MKKLLAVLMLFLIATTGCKKTELSTNSPEQESSDQNRPYEDFIHEHYEKYGKDFANQDPHQLMTRGIELYSAGKNAEAKIVMSAALVQFKDANTKIWERNDYTDNLFYLGNVCMNLNEPANAEYCYGLSRRGVNKVDSQYNLACALALQKKYEETKDRLLEGYVDYKDHNLARIESDPDLEGFRKTEYYVRFKKALSEIVPGHEPVDGNELRACLAGKSFDNGTGMGMGHLEFSRDGVLSINGGCFTREVGYWNVDDEKRVFTMKLIGIANVVDQKSRRVEEWDQFTTIPLREDIIPFSKIRIDEISWGFSMYSRKPSRVKKIVLGNAIENHVIHYDPAVAIKE